MKKNYRPLPKCVTISKSKIDGLGLYATEEIQCYKSLGISHVRDERFDNDMIRTPLGGFVNHSETPNCAFCDETTMYTLVTIKDINPGDELTVKYHLYNPIQDE
jgi:SET domain-containing protein|tara:strand:- start:606 stop:917 length:312 start_codon:yes stop_codon:yes gene_type:complete